MNGEVWCEVKDFEGLYAVSNMGRVKSLRKKDFYMKAGRGRGGYHTVCLNKLKKSHNKKIHKLVAIAFLGHVPCGFTMTVDHIDGDKNNNNLCNLQLLSGRDNVVKYHKEQFLSKYGTFKFKACTFEGCIKAHHAKGLCRNHYDNFKYLQKKCP